MRNESVSIGKSIVIKGEVSGAEDLTIEGQVEGRIQLRDHVLTVGPSAHVQAHVVAKLIIVLGHVTGDLTAHEKVEIREQGSVEGDIVAPRVAIADGANFRGSIDMRPKEVPAAVDGTVDGYKRDGRTPTPSGAPISV
jgi:cytoskeletal protein CcmA (bactofilin family)